MADKDESDTAYRKDRGSRRKQYRPEAIGALSNFVEHFGPACILADRLNANPEEDRIARLQRLEIQLASANRVALQAGSSTQVEYREADNRVQIWLNGQPYDNGRVQLQYPK